MSRLSIVLIAIFCLSSAGCGWRKAPVPPTWAIPSGSFTPGSYPASQVIETPYPNMTRPHLPFLQALGAPVYADPVTVPIDQPYERPRRKGWFFGNGPSGPPFAEFFSNLDAAINSCESCDEATSVPAIPTVVMPGPPVQHSSPAPVSPHAVHGIMMPDGVAPAAITPDDAGNGAIRGPGFGQLEPHRGSDWVEDHAALAAAIKQVADEQPVIR